MHFLEIFCQKKCFFCCQKQCFLGKKWTVTWYILHIILSKICNCHKNGIYALNENFCSHFCPRRKAANFCHPGRTQKSTGWLLPPPVLWAACNRDGVISGARCNAGGNLPPTTRAAPCIPYSPHNTVASHKMIHEIHFSLVTVWMQRLSHCTDTRLTDVHLKDMHPTMSALHGPDLSV